MVKITVDIPALMTFAELEGSDSSTWTSAVYDLGLQNWEAS
jgi:hypothetical protein